MSVRDVMQVGSFNEAKNFTHQMDVIEKGMIYIPKCLVAFFKRTLGISYMLDDKEGLIL